MIRLSYRVLGNIQGVVYIHIYIYIYFNTFNQLISQSLPFHSLPVVVLRLAVAVPLASVFHGATWLLHVKNNKKLGGLEKGTTSVVEGWIWANCGANSI